MKPFLFKEFTILQSEQVFRVGTDAVLIGALCNLTQKEHILEVGTGTGIISLMIAQRFPNAKITAIDINEDAIALADQNFKNSPFSERLSLQLADYNQITVSDTFEAIISNPPYFQENPSTKDKVARQQTSLSFRTLISTSAQLLCSYGKFCVIIPIHAVKAFCEIAEFHHFIIHRKVNIFGRQGGEIKRCLLEFTFYKSEYVEENFIIEKSPRNYSEEYLAVTEQFHVF